jgi:hypothetical protein
MKEVIKDEERLLKEYKKNGGDLNVIVPSKTKKQSTKSSEDESQ